MDGRGSRRIVGSGQERNFVRLLVGDRVVVELTPRDLTRGRIVKVVRQGIEHESTERRSSGFVTSARSSAAAAWCG